ncbi:hypothetical protein A6X21_02925 [Planctopirus hydrillae]|uniref:Uncharacterized protein n=1 Tax=Planctopirus hydrillae TaxID=1841610 RepID=A0A1C3EN37_9PLAN|nr:hypothetical protein A6X21_02925 [Planctopirus hydrillae]
MWLYSVQNYVFVHIPNETIRNKSNAARIVPLSRGKTLFVVLMSVVPLPSCAVLNLDDSLLAPDQFLNFAGSSLCKLGMSGGGVKQCAPSIFPHDCT